MKESDIRSQELTQRCNVLSAKYSKYGFNVDEIGNLACVVFGKPNIATPVKTDENIVKNFLKNKARVVISYRFILALLGGKYNSKFFQDMLVENNLGSHVRFLYIKPVNNQAL